MRRPALQPCYIKILLLLVLSSSVPTARAAGNAGAAESVDTAGFWLSFILLVVVSAIESIMSIIWIRVRFTSDDNQPCELSYRVCGRELFVVVLDKQDANEIMNSLGGRVLAFNSVWYSSHSGRGLLGFSTFGRISFRYDTLVRLGYFSVGWGDDVVASDRPGSASRTGCSLARGVHHMRKRREGSIAEVVIDSFCGLPMAITLMVRRFNPTMSMKSPAGLLRNAQDLIRPKTKRSFGKTFEHIIHMLIGAMDILIGIAGLALNSSSPHKLWNTLKDPGAAITLENYSTLFLMYWLLGLLLLLGDVTHHTFRKPAEPIAWPGRISFGVAMLANVLMFSLGCWKLDYARRHRLAWTPVLSYWIGSTSAISFPLLGVEVFHVFGFIGMVLMLKDAFS